ncbi:hypothetical protein D770_16245 [Flammeovirgaceae bacterium 311]|nr:hypothetical protein D770_16245 [Flammeovirgaceae bacterium 311]
MKAMKIGPVQLLIIFVACCFTGCIKPYEPPILAEGNKYLVVEGYLTSGSPTTILLSRTSGLSNKEEIRAEAAAVVTVESQSGTTYTLQETTGGEYTAELDLNTQEHYRLNIKTLDGKNYLSDYVPYKNTPPIDDLSWIQKDDNNVYILINTHDPQNSTWYYKWDYEETWEWRASLSPFVDYVNGEFVPRTTFPPQRCWGNEKSKDILTASSVRYGTDIIKDHVLTIVPWHSWKITTKYSILVKQYALSKEAYEYFQQVKRNSEELGSLFDPQPVELAGNIYYVDAPNEPVVGFFGAGSVHEQRIFIDNLELRNWDYNWECVTRKVPVDSFEYYFGQGRLAPFSYNPLDTTAQGLYNLHCIDCSLRANPVKPDFWE